MGPWGRLLKKLPGDLFSPESFLSIKFIVFFIRHVFTPYGIRMYARSRDGDVGEPTVFPCAVPVLDISRDNNRNALFQFNRRLAFLYIPAFASDTDQKICCPPAPSEVWICQQVRHPGSKVTLLMNSGISSFGNTIGDRNDTPVKYCEKVSFVWPAPNRLARSNSSRFRYFMTRLLRSVPLQTPCLAQAPPCRDTFLNCHAPPCISPASCGHPSPSRQAPRHGDCS